MNTNSFSEGNEALYAHIQLLRENGANSGQVYNDSCEAFLAGATALLFFIDEKTSQEQYDTGQRILEAARSIVTRAKAVQ